MKQLSNYIDNKSMDGESNISKQGSVRYILSSQPTTQTDVIISLFPSTLLFSFSSLFLFPFFQNNENQENTLAF